MITIEHRDSRMAEYLQPSYAREIKQANLYGFTLSNQVTRPITNYHYKQKSSYYRAHMGGY